MIAEDCLREPRKARRGKRSEASASALGCKDMVAMPSYVVSLAKIEE
ncbi:MAG: hypothetical protein K2W95_15085 [Candidatus Obscuribacterales bacterium]|nr:hypothetical protein [Candidatus Obscuribacterales bacterium]